MNSSADYGFAKSHPTDYTNEEERVAMFCRQNDGLLCLMQTRMNPFFLACLKLKYAIIARPTFKNFHFANSERLIGYFAKIKA